MPIILLIIFGLIMFFIYKKAKNFYDRHKFTIKYLIVTSIVWWIWSIISAIIYDDFDLAVESSLKVPTVSAALYIYLRLSYKSRLKKHINRYIESFENTSINNNDVTVSISDSQINLSGTNPTCILAERSFMSESKTVKFLNERYKIHGEINETFIKELYNNLVLDHAREYLQKYLTTDRIFFYYEFYAYICYFQEQNIDFIEYISNLNIMNTDTIYYFSGIAFFSSEVNERMDNDFLEFCVLDETISETAFSKNYLANKMCENRFLDKYINPQDLEKLYYDKKMFMTDLMDMYDNMSGCDVRGYLSPSFSMANMYNCVAKNQITDCMEARIIDAMSPLSDDAEAIYIFKNEDENGIIKKEYGQRFEQHRVSLDDGLSADQLNELEGCPA